MMKAVSFMYLRPPGYNAESAKAAEVADEQKKAEESTVLPSTGYHGSGSINHPLLSNKETHRFSVIFTPVCALQVQYYLAGQSSPLRTHPPKQLKERQNQETSSVAPYRQKKNLKP